MLIKKLSFKFSKFEELVPLPIRNQSGTLKETSQPVRQGSSHLSELVAYIPGITPDLDILLKKIVAMGAIFEAEDVAGNVFTLGDDDVKAALTLDKKNEGKAGSIYGYDIKITCNSANGTEVKSFQ